MFIFLCGSPYLLPYLLFMLLFQNFLYGFWKIIKYNIRKKINFVQVCWESEYENRHGATLSLPEVGARSSAVK